MDNDLRSITPAPEFRLLSNGGPATACQLMRRPMTTRGPFEVDPVIAVYDNHEEAERAI